MSISLLLVLLAILAGLYLAFNIGANDVANTMGTAVGSRAISIKQAIIIGAVCEFLGALLVGDEVSRTISKGFVSPTIFADDPRGFALGMTAAIFATALWLQFATFKGLPVSTTHSIVGAVLGFAIIQSGIFNIDFIKLAYIFSSWIISPILGGLLSFLILRFVLKYIIDHNNPLKQSKRFVPLMIATSVFILTSAFLPKLLKRIIGEEYVWLSFIISITIAFILSLYFRNLFAAMDLKSLDREHELQLNESVFAKMQFITACFLAFAHGSNDVANAIGPAAAVVSALLNNNVQKMVVVPFWLLSIGGVGIVVGLCLLGRKVIYTVGESITEITPSRGFSAEFGASLTILFGSILGIPLSSTHVLVGCVIGVGLARGIGGIDLLVIRRIARSWLITMPVTAVISMVLCLLVKNM